MSARRRYYVDLALDDEDAPQPGEILRGPLVDHLIVDAWPTESDAWANRWTCVIRSLGPHDGRPDRAGRRIRPVVTYRRGEGPLDRFGP